MVGHEFPGLDNCVIHHGGYPQAAKEERWLLSDGQQYEHAKKDPPPEDSFTTVQYRNWKRYGQGIKGNKNEASWVGQYLSGLLKDV